MPDRVRVDMVHRRSAATGCTAAAGIFSGRSGGPYRAMVSAWPTVRRPTHHDNREQALGRQAALRDLLAGLGEPDRGEHREPHHDLEAGRDTGSNRNRSGPRDGSVMHPLGPTDARGA
jgi:hypothetical protein